MNPPTHDAQHFLDLIRKAKKGRLKIYIGMIAGVGKTYRMLQEAHQLLAAGVNVKIGYIETHGRAETQALVAGLPHIARKTVFYKGKELEEMDLEAILTERPDIVLVDELAHTNIPGSKNEKRWQDVADLIGAGINVITAFNIQHLESLNDKVFSVTGIEVTERIPDTFLWEADEVVDIDLPAEDLIQRLKAGKIYKPERAQAALDNFFQPDKILLLRELALRQVAKNLEKKIDSAGQGQAAMTERFMACISTNDKMARKIIRKTARLAGYYHAEWLVVYVQPKEESAARIDSRLQTRLLQNMKMAVEMGGRVVQYLTPGLEMEESRKNMRRNAGKTVFPMFDNGISLLHSDKSTIPEVLFKAALLNQVTNIVIGRPNESLWRRLTGRNYFTKLVKKIAETEMDLIVVT